MKIIFLCGCVEPGRDGVGDYCRKLAAEFIRKGDEVGIISLVDAYVKEIQQEEQPDEEQQIPVWRIPRLSALSPQVKAEQIRQWITQFNPDILSIHYVPYAYDKRGMAFGLASYLKQITRGYQVHIMFHETWLGEAKSSPLKEKIVGFVQKKIAYHIIAKLKPAWLSTSNQYYSNCFSGFATKPQIIPVFSNMPLGSAKSSAIAEVLATKIKGKRTDFILASFFGSLLYHKDLNRHLLTLAIAVKEQLGKELVITHVGRSRGVEDQFAAISSSTGIQAFALGEWAEQEISDYLYGVDLGLTNYPKILYEKSGSISGLLYNSCPVIFLKESFEPDNRFVAELREVHELNDLRSFYSQPKDFYKKYEVTAACNKYRKMYSN